MKGFTTAATTTRTPSTFSAAFAAKNPNIESVHVKLAIFGLYKLQKRIKRDRINVFLPRGSHNSPKVLERDVYYTKCSNFATLVVVFSLSVTNCDGVQKPTF